VSRTSVSDPDPAPGPAPDFATKPTLRRQHVTLRPMTGEDAEAMAQILSDPKVRLLTGSVETTAQAHEPALDDTLVQWYASRPDRTTASTWPSRTRGRTPSGGGAQRLRPSGTYVQPARPHRAAGRDRGSEPGRRARRAGIRDLGLTRITLEVLDTNPRGRRVYEKVGYRPTGHRDQAAVLDGQDIGALDMSVDADTWPGYPA
jgi:RimJ/RimL family protein N-acetyltransferase